MGGSNEDGGIENDSHGIAVVVSGESCRGKFIAKGARSKRIDFMAALHSGAAFSEKESGVLEGVAMSRVARDEAHLAAFCTGSPPERRHQ